MEAYNKLWGELPRRELCDIRTWSLRGRRDPPAFACRDGPGRLAGGQGVLEERLGRLDLELRLEDGLQFREVCGLGKRLGHDVAQVLPDVPREDEPGPLL